jgi:hypothetical protein
MNTHHPTVTRWEAFKELWMHRSYWRLHEPHQILRSFRDQQLVEMMPFFIVVAALAGGFMFVLIPSLLPEQAAGLTGFIWPSWVATAAPMICAQTMALLVAPTMALELIEKHQSGYFKTLNSVYGAPAGYPCVSWIVALSAVCVIASYVMIFFSIVIGLGVALILSIGDVRATFDAVLLAAPPIKWLRTGSTAAILGAICGLSVVLHAWPGTAFSNSVGDNASHTHRLGLRVMLTCSIVVALTGVVINAIIGLFDRSLL